MWGTCSTVCVQVWCTGKGQHSVPCESTCPNNLFPMHAVYVLYTLFHSDSHLSTLSNSHLHALGVAFTPNRCIGYKKLRCLSPVQSVLTSVPRKSAFHTNMHISCVASQLKWRVAVQLWDNVAGKLVAYVGSWHLVRLVLCCPSCLLLSLPILITPISAEFWTCVCAKRDRWVSQTSLLHGRPCLLVFHVL